MADVPGQQQRCRPVKRHAVLASAMLVCATLLGACTATPTPVAPVAAPAQPSLQELMQQAQNAQRDNQRERARQSWRAAAKAYPTQKAPWQRLAEDYFETSDYGNAILAAQEVLQRDDQDTLAHSVLAVSGLRLSTVSLVALRERTNYPVGSREEAQSLTRAMREALGENALVPQRLAEPARGVQAAEPAAQPIPGPARASRASANASARPAAAAVAHPTIAASAAARPALARGTAAAVGPGAAVPATQAPKGSVVPVTSTSPAAAAKPAANDPFKLLK